MENVFDCYYDYKLEKFVLKDSKQQINRNINFLINELRQYANEKNEKDVNEEYAHRLQWEQEDVKILLECIDYLKESSKINLQMAKNNLDKAEHYKTLADIYCLRLEKRQQQLISFLEDKIKEYKLCFPEVVKALQEVLNFVNKGGKDE